jgi:hypothetical protein
VYSEDQLPLVAIGKKRTGRRTKRNDTVSEDQQLTNASDIAVTRHDKEELKITRLVANGEISNDTEKKRRRANDEAYINDFLYPCREWIERYWSEGEFENKLSHYMNRNQ